MSWVISVSESNCRGLSRVRLRLDALRPGFVSLCLPLLYFVVVDAPERQQFFFVVYKVLSCRSCQRIVFHQENGFLRAHFLTKTAEDAPKHVDLKLLRSLFNITRFGSPCGTRGDYTDCLGRANKLTQLAGNAFSTTDLVFHQIGGSPIALGHNPLLLGILHRHLPFEKVTNRDFKTPDYRRQVKPFPKIEFCSFYYHLRNHFG